MALESDGTCRVTGASSADDALATVAWDRPDAAIIDAVLPRVSGLELARQMVDIGVPVLVMSGEPAQQQRLLENGCPFLPKPFSVKQLIAETRQLLDDAWRRKAELSVALARLTKNLAELSMAHEPARATAERAWAECEARYRRARREMYRPRPGLAEILAIAVSETGADMGDIQMAEVGADALRIVASQGFGAAFLSFFDVVHLGGDCACGAAFRRAERIIVPDIAASPIFAGKPSGKVMLDAGVRSVQSTPLVGRSGRVLGMISTHRRTVWHPNGEELHRLNAIAHRAAIEIEVGV